MSLSPRKRPRKPARRCPRVRKSPQGLPTIDIHLRLFEPSYHFLHLEAAGLGISESNFASRILWQMAQSKGPKPFDGKSGKGH